MTYRMPSLSKKDFDEMLSEIHSQGGYDMTDTLQPHDGMYNCSVCRERVKFGHECHEEFVTVAPIRGEWITRAVVEPREVLAVVEGLMGMLEAAYPDPVANLHQSSAVRAAEKLVARLKESGK